LEQLGGSSGTLREKQARQFMTGEKEGTRPWRVRENAQPLPSGEIKIFRQRVESGKKVIGKLQSIGAMPSTDDARLGIH